MRAAVVLCAVALIGCVSAADEADRIKSLPGWSGTDPMYSGYLNVDATNDRNLFYWHVKTTSTAANPPVVLWLNGGPGCSSVGGGFFSEQGPFMPAEDGTLTRNVYSWHGVANTVYIESPAGVGFSYSNVTSDYTVGDQRTAEDIYKALLGFFEKFPELSASPFWIATESYGGHYGPTSALAILQGNANQPDKTKLINFQGFMAGNAWTVAELDNEGAVLDWTSHAIVARSTGKGILENCNMSDVGPLLLRQKIPALQRMFTTDSDSLCDKYQNEAMEQFAHLNIYDIFADVCTSSTPSSEEPATNWSANVSSNNQAGCSRFYRPCVDDYTSKYLNRQDVQAAIHVRPGTVPGGQWSECSSVVDYSRFDLLTSMLPVYKQLFSIKPDLHVLIYSGDIDAIVPVTGTLNWLEAFTSDMGWPVSDAKRAWLVNDQVGGFVTKYGATPGLTFTTVRGAGHMVPQGQQARALYMFSQWVNQKPF